jgi:glucose/arabinose dehydrogenase/mono/diheme cytochrome c family protein
MKERARKIFIGSVGSWAVFFLFGCSSKTSEPKSIAMDSISIASGQTLFAKNCSSCHNFNQDGIGPQLSGVTITASQDWIESFVRDPKAMIESGDDRAQTLFKRYHSVMPSFASLSQDELRGIMAFLNTKKVVTSDSEMIDPYALKNPIAEPIPMSDLVVNVELFTQIPPSSDIKPVTRIAKLDHQPNSDKLFVMDLRGRLYEMRGNEPIVYLDLVAMKRNFIHEPGLATGFGSFAFHPEFLKNGLLYTTHAESPGSGKADFDFSDSIKVDLQWVLSEWKTKQPGASPFSGESREVFRVDMPTVIHGMQEISFNPLSKPGDDDYSLLYIGIGDGGSAEIGYPFLCHNTERPWGTILRIDPRGNNSPNENYGIPASNPFVKGGTVNTLKEIFAFGFRNPHRITWSKEGYMFVSNIGHHNIEGLYLVQPGFDCGWPMREGTFVIDPSQNMQNIYPLPPDDEKFKINYPVAQYDHDEGNAISGGFEYWGKAIPQLVGKFLFGDIVNGRLFYVEMKDLALGSRAPIKEWQISINGIRKTLKELCGADKVDERFGRGNNGELFIMTKPDGKIYRLVSASAK